MHRTASTHLLCAGARSSCRPCRGSGRSCAAGRPPRATTAPASHSSCRSTAPDPCWRCCCCCARLEWDRRTGWWRGVGGGGGWRPCVFWHKVGRQQGQQASCGLWGAQACFIAAGRQAASHLESLSQHQLQARVRGLGPGIVGVGQVRPFCGAVPVPPRPYYCSSLSQFVLQKKYIHTFCFYNTHVCVDQYLRVLLLVSLVNPSGCACPQVYKWRLSFVPLPPPASTR
jgi:hypothetical protein